MAGLKRFNSIKLSVLYVAFKTCAVNVGRDEADGAGAAWSPGWINHVRLRVSIARE